MAQFLEHSLTGDAPSCDSNGVAAVWRDQKPRASQTSWPFGLHDVVPGLAGVVHHFSQAVLVEMQ